jgi:AraC-like DNA-binding protein
MESFWADHWHANVIPVHELIHVIEGSAEVQSRRSSFVANSGDTFLIPKGRLHRDVHPTGKAYRVVLVFFMWPEADGLIKSMNPKQFLNAPAAAKTHLQLMMKDLESLYAEEAVSSPDQMRILLLEVLLALMRYSRPISPISDARRAVSAARRTRLAESVRDWLLRNYSQPFSLSELADRHLVSTFHLSRTFSQEFGMAITDMLSTIRMEHAKDLLRSGKLTVKEVACRTGFSDPNYFTKAFRRVTGFSPSEFQLIDRHVESQL